MDTLVFDIETQNFFTSPEVGWGNFDALKISVVCVYSYAHDKYFSFTENEMDKLAAMFGTSNRIVGFSMNRYDVPVIQAYFNRLGLGHVNLWTKERVDLLEEVELTTGKRVSLDRLARANLTGGKLRHSWEAIDLYNEGRLDELREYCLKDVEITKDLYDLFRTRNYLFIPDRETGSVSKISF
ncbi:MAG: ribonuclease H-like domain-containing protein [Patescibacteria group bacterium]